VTAPILRLGIVGLGGAARQMLPSLTSHPCVRLTAAADPRPEARARFESEFGGTVFEDVEALCASDTVDAVYIASPHQWHRRHVLAAAAGGKHAIVEKPMALTLEDCDAMIAAVEAAGVHLVVGHTHSFDAPVRKMADIIRSGSLGPLAMVHSFNYTPFLYRPRRPEELDTAQGGGIIFNQVPHQVDSVRLLGGGLVRSVRASAWVLDPARPTEGCYSAFLEFENGAVATLVYSGYDGFDSDEFHGWVGELGDDKPRDRHGRTRAALATIGGPDAEAAMKFAAGYGAGPSGARAADRPASHHPHFGVTLATLAGGDLRAEPDGVGIYDRNGRRFVDVPRGRAFPDKDGVIDELYDAVTAGRPPLHDGRWGRATMEVCLAVLASGRERREITLTRQVAAATRGVATAP